MPNRKPDKTSILDYLAGAGKEYPSIADLIRVIMAAQYGQNMDMLTDGTGDIRAGVKNAAGVARESVGRNARESVGLPPLGGMNTADGANGPGGLAAPRDRVNLPVYNKRDPFGINSSIGDLAVPEGTTVPMREPWEVEHEANFAKFKEMNPNLDYAKVAQQSGGNVPGGTLSVTDNEFWDDPSHPQSNQAYYDAVDKLVYEQELRSRQDPRSRGYDPTTAQQMIDAKIAERDASANEIYGKAQMLRAQAEGGQLEMARRAMEMENTPIGRARALTPIMLQSMSQVDPDLAVLIARATYMINSDDPMLQAQGLEMLSSLQGGNTNQAQVNKTGKPE